MSKISTTGLLLRTPADNLKNAQPLPAVTAAIFFVGAVGAVLSMLELPVTPQILAVGLVVLIVQSAAVFLKGVKFTAFSVTIAVSILLIFVLSQDIRDGLKLIANQLFALSEQYQAYMYSHFAVGAPPENHEKLVFLALVPLMAIGGLISGILMRQKSRILFLCAAAIFAGTQIYFGIFPAPFWNIAFFAAAAVSLIFDAGQEFRLTRSLTLFLAALVLLTSVVGFAYSGESAALSELSESLRDKFDEKLERPLGALLSTQETMPQEQILDLRLREESVGQNEGSHSGAQFETEREESFSGSQLGTATAQRLWVLWLIFAAFLLGAGIWVFIKVRKDMKIRANFDSENHQIAINSMFMYLMRWLVMFGLEPQNCTYPEYAAEIETLLAREYAAEYVAATALWQEAVYSLHEMTPDNRAQMRAFLEHSVQLICEKVGFFAGLRIRLKIIFGNGGII